MKEGWSNRKIGDICSITDFVSNGSFASLKENVKYYNSPNYAILIRLADASNGFDKSKFVYTDKHGYDFSKKSHLQGGELIMSNVGSVGSMFICPVMARPMTLAPNTISITSKNNKFLYYYFHSKGFKEKLKGITSSTTLKKFNKTNFKLLEIAIPSPSEQQSIVDYLDAAFAKIDALKANAEKQLKDARALFQASLKEMLEPKEGWISMKLGDFAYMKAGDFVKASDIYQNYAEGLYPCYGGNGLRGYVSEPNQKGDYCLIGRQGALCGCVNRAKGIFRTTEHAVIVKPYQDIPTSLVYYMLINLNLNKYATGAAQPGLSVKNIAEQVIIPVPPQSAHFTLAATLDALSAKVKELEKINEQTQKECDALKQAMLREIFE